MVKILKEYHNSYIPAMKNRPCYKKCYLINGGILEVLCYTIVLES